MDLVSDNVGMYIGLVLSSSATSGTCASVKYDAMGWGYNPRYREQTVSVVNKRPVREHDDDDQQIDRAAAKDSPCLIIKTPTDTFLYLLSAEKYAVDNC